MMSQAVLSGFHFIDWDIVNAAKTDVERYQLIGKQALEGRIHNPKAFDALSVWMRDEGNWRDDRFEESKALFMDEIIGRLRAQNAKLRETLMALQPQSIVNEVTYRMLDEFDRELAGDIQWDDKLQSAVSALFADFAAIKNPAVRNLIAGGKMGTFGTDTVEVFGYINRISQADSQVQWALFMPDMVKNQQRGFKVDHFEYRKPPAMRFIGVPTADVQDLGRRLSIMNTLDAMADWKSEIDFDAMLMHHYGRGVDVDPGHGFWGRFMKSNVPVPEGFVSFDFLAEDNGAPGLPFCSQMAYAEFSGDMAAIHSGEGYDVNAMYDVTRNTMLGQGVIIPYPEKYWTAELFLNGCDQDSTVFLFSALVQ